MAAPAKKRRKIEHTSSNEDSDDASFVSFGASEDESDGEVQPHIDQEQDSDGESLNESSDAAEVSDGKSESSIDGIEEPQHTKFGANPSEGTKRSNGSNGKIATPQRNDKHRNTGSGSSMLAVQIDKLLSRIRPKHGKKESAAEGALHEIKSTIEGISPGKPASIEEAERMFANTKSKVAIPFPNPRPSKDAKYKFEYTIPSNINIVGSYALKTYSRIDGAVVIDMIVAMPSTIFQEKDFLDYRYFYKRAYYLACIAAGLREAHEEFRMRFQSLHGDTLKPIIVVSPSQTQSDTTSTEGQKSNWQINIIPCILPDVFSREKLRPDKSCIRASSAANGDDAGRQSTPTPFYNSSLRADMLMAQYLKALHQASKRCPEWKDACLLGRTWLKQRGFSSTLYGGGFGNFELSTLMALLLDGDRPVLGERWSSYQLFRATLQFLATRDASASAIALGRDENTVDPSAASASTGSPVLWDSDRVHNLFYKTSPWSYKPLKQEAKNTLNALADQRFDKPFQATFTLRADQLLFRFDYILQLDDTLVASLNSRKQFSDALGQYQKLYSVLQRGLGDRISLLALMPPLPDSWELSSTEARKDVRRQLRIGFIVNPSTIDRTVDHGPSAEDKVEAISFRKFWGEKAELRRFKDGSILESLVWDAQSTRPIFEQIVRYLVTAAFGQEAEKGVTVTEEGLKKMLPQTSKLDVFKPMMDAYTQLESDIRSLEDLPLSVRQIMPCDPQLRYASISSPGSARQHIPSDVTIQFGGSTRWPDDIVAVQRTKIAFLLNISERLQESVEGVTTRVGLENEEYDILNQAFLDIIYESGVAFRLRINHEREQLLLERKLKDKTPDLRSRELAAQGLAKYKRDCVKCPAFTQAIARLCNRHPALSGAIRLTKKWFASHLLSNHIAEEVIEMMVSRTFIQPWPWQKPSSVQAGFLRTLWWTSRWDWRNEPLIVDLSGSGDLKQAEMQTIRTKFEAWRSLDPALNRVVLFCASNVDPDGTAWTDGQTPRVVAARMTSLASATCTEIEQRGLQLDPIALFSSGLSDFDFIVHLHPDFAISRAKRKHTTTNGTSFKNLEVDLYVGQRTVGYRPVDEFRRELEDIYGSSALFFSGRDERPIIAGLWNPQTVSRAWRLNLAYSTIPERSSGEDESLASINKEAVLAEIARLGGDMLQKIDINRQ